MARVLLAGCGRLGLRSAALLLEGGHQVYGLRRHWPSGSLPAGLQPLTADLLDRSALAACLPTGIDVLIHSLTPGERSEAAYRLAYLDTLQALLAAPQLADPGLRWLLVSSTAVYGDAGGAEIDEHTPAAPVEFNGRVLLEAETALRGARKNSLCLRLGGIYGPGREMLLRRLREGRHSVQRQPPHWSNRIHAEDAARMLAFLASRAETGVINGVDCEPVDEARLADWLCERLGLPPAASRAAGSFRPNRRILPTRLREAGFRWRYPDWRIGYDELITDSSAGTPSP